jgi:hypothetical protein
MFGLGYEFCKPTKIVVNVGTLVLGVKYLGIDDGHWCMWRQLHQIFEHVHDCHHCEYSLPGVGLMFVLSLGEWLKVWLSPFINLVWLQLDVVH